MIDFKLNQTLSLFNALPVFISIQNVLSLNLNVRFGLGIAIYLKCVNYKDHSFMHFYISMTNVAS